MNPPDSIPWSAEEDCQLREMLGDMPLFMVASHYNGWAVRSGYPRRTARAIQCRARRTGVPTQSTGQWLSLQEVARLLGIGDRRLKYLGRQQKLLELRQGRGGPFYVSRKQLETLARKQPHWLSGATYEGLMLLFADRDLALSVINAPAPFPQVYRGPIIDRLSGRAWPSIKSASKHLYLGRRTILDHLRADAPRGGLHLVPAIPRKPHITTNV